VIATDTARAANGNVPSNNRSPLGVACIANGSTVRGTQAGPAGVENRYSLEVAWLGACPGTPVDGLIATCADDVSDPDCGRAEVDGAALPALDSDGTPPTGLWHTGTFELTDGSLLKFEYDRYQPDGSGVITRGILITPGRSPAAGAIYCIDGGEWSERSGATGIFFRQFSRLGSCPAAGSERIEACSWRPIEM
jgi:hypothetical protein